MRNFHQWCHLPQSQILDVSGDEPQHHDRDVRWIFKESNEDLRGKIECKSNIRRTTIVKSVRQPGVSQDNHQWIIPSASVLDVRWGGRKF
jgi:hypothetical protein